jgi:hypothetical protein
MADRDGHVNRPGALQSLRLLAEGAQLEIKRSNDEYPSQSEASECLGSPYTERVEMGATEADLSLGVGPEVARPALRPLGGRSPPLAQKTSPTGTRGRESESHARPKDIAPCFRRIFEFRQ